jgi:hypothetical protein
MIPNLDVLAQYARRFQQAACTITTDGGDPTFDPTTGTYTDPARVTIYTGGCLVQPAGGQRVVQFEEQAVSLRTYEVHLSGVASGVEPGQQVAVTSSRDTDLDGLDLVVLDVEKSSTLTNRRIICEERMR